ncbi:MAG: extracellular solute-binding protein [Candidatus Roizmanbacteria bacterium]
MSDDNLALNQEYSQDLNQQQAYDNSIQGDNVQNLYSDNIQPEELSPDISSTDDAMENEQAPEIPSEEIMPVSEENNKAKYLIIAGAVGFFVIIFAIILAVILGRGTTQKKPVTLTYWGLWDEKQIYESVFQDYIKRNPHVKIEYQKYSPAEYRQRILARSPTGAGPDIFRFHNTWLSEVKDVVSSIPQEVMTNAQFESTFFSIHSKDLKLGNSYYGIPLYVDGLVLIYNNSLLSNAGISEPPSNWDDMINYIEKLTVKDSSGVIQTSGLAIGNAVNVDHFSDIFGLLLIQNGGTLKGLDSQYASQALESYRSFAEPPKEYWNADMPNSINAFAQGKVAMVIAPTWEVISLKAMNPDLEIKVAPVPIVPGSKQITIANYWAEGVSKYSKNQLEAWKLLKFMSEKESLTKIYEAQKKTRPFGSPYSRKDLASTLANDPYVGTIITQAENDNLVSIPLISRTFDAGLNDNIIKYIENAVNSTSQGVSYTESLSVAKKGIDQILLQYGIE